MATEDEMYRQLKVLSEELWEGRCKKPQIDAWLGNFKGDALPLDQERLHALHLLSHFNYFGLREIRVLLQAIYRDLYRYPIIQDIRKRLGWTRDADQVEAEFKSVLAKTRFLGMGNPSESGTHLLYYFRQENHLEKDVFASEYQLYSGPASAPGTILQPADLERVVLIDDLCGSGQQAVEYGQTVVEDLRTIAARSNRQLHISYHAMFGTVSGLALVRRTAGFDEVAAVHELSNEYRTFSLESRVFRNCPPDIDAGKSKTIAEHYGRVLAPGMELGYRRGQLLLGFAYNVPDNTLPIIWAGDGGEVWTPIIRRYQKVL